MMLKAVQLERMAEKGTGQIQETLGKISNETHEAVVIPNAPGGAAGRN